MSKSVYVRVVHDLELLRSVLRCAIESDRFNFELGLIKYIVIVNEEGGGGGVEGELRGRQNVKSLIVLFVEASF